MPPLIPAEVDKIREPRQRQQECHRGAGKTAAVLEALKRRGEELIGRSQGADKDLAAKGA